MTRITMLGTGSGDTVYLYNTCFTIENEKGVFLVDTGGSNEIVKRLREKNFTLNGLINVYCNDVVYDTIKGVADYVLQTKLTEYIYNMRLIIVLIAFFSMLKKLRNVENVKC